MTPPEKPAQQPADDKAAIAEAKKKAAADAAADKALAAVLATRRAAIADVIANSPHTATVAGPPPPRVFAGPSHPSAPSDWKPLAQAQSILDADMNLAMNGRDAEGYRHRGIYGANEVGQFEGSLEDAMAELSAAHVNRGDYLDYGPDQIGGNRFAGWASLTDGQTYTRGFVIRYVLLTNLIPTAAERKIATPFAYPQFDASEAYFRDMTADDLWEWILKIRAATAGGGSASGGDPVASTPSQSGGSKG